MKSSMYSAGGKETGPAAEVDCQGTVGSQGWQSGKGCLIMEMKTLKVIFKQKHIIMGTYFGKIREGTPDPQIYGHRNLGSLNLTQ